MRTQYGKLQQQVYDLMLYIHKTDQALTAYWVSAMDEAELNERLEMYARVMNPSGYPVRK